MQDTKPVCLRLPEDLVREMDLLADAAYIDRSSFILLALQNLLRRLEEDGVAPKQAEGTTAPSPAYPSSDDEALEAAEDDSTPFPPRP